MSKYALNISDDGRVLSATYAEYASSDSVIVDRLPDGDIAEYRYVAGNYIYDPLTKSESLLDSGVEVTIDDVLTALLGVM